MILGLHLDTYKSSSDFSVFARNVLYLSISIKRHRFPTKNVQVMAFLNFLYKQLLGWSGWSAKYWSEITKFLNSMRRARI